MTWNYANAPHIRPLFFTVIFLLALAAYGWSRRRAWRTCGCYQRSAAEADTIGKGQHQVDDCRVSLNRPDGSLLFLPFANNSNDIADFFTP